MCLVKFSAVTFKPLVNEVVDAVVSDVEKVIIWLSFVRDCSLEFMRMWVQWKCLLLWMLENYLICFTIFKKIPSDFEYVEFPKPIF